MPVFTYSMIGTDAKDITWTVNGEVTIRGEGMFTQAVEQAQRAAFFKITKGQAVYGRPGETCAGPYKILSLFVVLKDEK